MKKLLINLQQLHLQQQQEHHTQEFLETILERQNVMKQVQREQDRKLLLELGKLFSGE